MKPHLIYFIIKSFFHFTAVCAHIEKKKLLRAHVYELTFLHTCVASSKERKKERKRITPQKPLEKTNFSSFCGCHAELN